MVIKFYTFNKSAPVVKKLCTVKTQNLSIINNNKGNKYEECIYNERIIIPKKNTKLNKLGVDQVIIRYPDGQSLHSDETMIIYQTKNENHGINFIIEKCNKEGINKVITALNKIK